MSIKKELVDFSDMSGGKNSAFPRHAINNNQVCDTLNLIHENIGISRAPGYEGKASALFTSPIRGMFVYITDDGTEHLLAVSGSKLYHINTSTWTATEKGVGLITADADCYGVNAAGKFWIVNGTNFIKVESDLNAYRVGIAAPTGTSAAAKAGGSLAAGVYGCYVTYSRKDASGRYLHSLPYSLGNVTLSAGNLTVTFTIPNSADAQVTNKVIWMTDAGGSIPYYYGEVNNITTIFDITSAASRNGLLLMSTQAASNVVLPITPSGIFTFDDKLYVFDINDRTIYWSLKTDINPFDMERFLTQNFRVLSATVNAAFSVGDDLYFNHIGQGVSRCPYGDMSSVIKFVQRRMWFIDTKTQEGKSNVCYYKGIAWGMTNDGFRYFDGNGFSEDLSFHIKPDIDFVYAGVSSTFLPCAVVNRRANKRTEYRLSFRNTQAGTTMNNTQLVFNLDYFFDVNNQRKTWEYWENGFSDMNVYNGSWIGAQSITSGGHIVRESVAKSDVNCYIYNGTFSTVNKLKQIYMLSRTVIDELNAVTIWGEVYALATAAGVIDGNLIRFDAQNSHDTFQIVGSGEGTGVLPSQASGESLPLPFAMAPKYPIASGNAMPFDARGNSVAIEITQLQDDSDFFLYKLQLPRAMQVINNIT